MEFRILGPLAVVGENGPLLLPHGRSRSLLALLTIQPGRVIPTDRLIDQLWGSSPPATATTKLYGLVSTLRRVLKPDRSAGEKPEFIETQAPGYVLAVDPDQVDAHRFRRLVGEAGRLAPSEKEAVLGKALELWTGPALADFSFEPFAQSEIISLQELRLTALEDLTDARLDLGRHASLVADLEALVAKNPFRERLRAQAMLAHYRSGHQTEALRIYRDAYETLAEELGIEPGPELQELERAILNHDPALSLKPRPNVDGEHPDSPPSMQPWLAESRRTVTVVFVDLGVPPAVRPDPEANRATARRAYETVTETLQRHGGTVQGSIGGVIVAIFGVPAAHEDDPWRAVKAAAEIVGRVAAISSDADRAPAARIGINTGDVIIGDISLVGSAVSGDTVKLAARLQQSAADGEVLIGDTTGRLVGDAAIVEPAGRLLDGGGRRMVAWRLVAVEPFGHATTPPRDAPLVGRETELGQLLEAFETTARSGRPVRLTVVGDAGIGKSRLARELTTTIGADAHVLTGHCPSYGEGVTFWPLREIVHQAGGGTHPEAIRRLVASVDDAAAIAEHVAGVIGSGEAPPRPDDLFPALRRFVELLARERPLVLILEDVHWAQSTLLDLLEYLTDSVEAAVFLLCLARPMFLEQRPRWKESRERTEWLRLDSLDRDAVEKLVEFGLPRHRISYERAEPIIDVAEGNPLFVEQLLAALRDNVQLVISPSLQALLIARLDRLGPAERDLIRAAAVLGRRFELAVLSHLLPPQARGWAASHLESLEQKELIIRGEGDTYTFRHALIQLAAYQTVTKDARARLHEQVADLAEETGVSPVQQVDEMVGYHLERAVEYRRELAADDAQTGELAIRAAGRLLEAGLRAFGRFDVVAAENLLSRVERLLPRDHADRWMVRRHLAEAYQVMGHHDRAERSLDELVAEIPPGADRTVEHHLRMEQARVRIARGPDPVSLESIEERADLARRVFEEAEDQVGLAKSCFVAGLIHLRRGQPVAMEGVMRRGLEHAGRSGSAREQLGAQWRLAMALEEGKRPVEECIDICDDLAAWQDTENPGVVSTLGYLWAMRGYFDEARRLANRARKLLQERVRARRPLGQVLRRAADVELLAGDIEAGERYLRDALEINLDMAENHMISSIAATLSRVLMRHGDVDQAADLAVMSSSRAPSQSVACQALWRSAHARVLAMSGSRLEAEALARDAVELVPPDMLNLSAEVLVDLGEVLALCERRDRAAEVLQDAISVFEAKGNLAGAAQTAAISSGLSSLAKHFD
ncbi:MAG: BTAD domain-containing putative transcriptional regulator [Acidimicrobiia bacterium]